ncbi:MAG: ECF transporter S component [Bacilli bacterium]|nr:ECF transporter S component [Bacilli bacterium]
MINNAFGYSLKPIQKICLAGLFIALTTILQKVVAINYIPVIPFVRISLGGPALIMFSSIFLGPIYGMIVGFASDVLGYFVFDPKTYGMFWQITAIYTVLGLVSYFVFYLFKLFKNRKLCFVIEVIIMLALATIASLFFILNDQVTLYSSTYTIATWQKIAIPIIIFVLFGLLILALLLINRKTKEQEYSIWQISFSCFVIELTVMVLFGSLMKAWAFNFNFFVIATCQLVVLFINIPLNTIFISLFMRLTKRFQNKQEVGQ